METKGNPIIIKWDVNLFPTLHIASYIESSLVEEGYQDWEYPDHVKGKSETSLLLSYYPAETSLRKNLVVCRC